MDGCFPGTRSPSPGCRPSMSLPVWLLGLVKTAVGWLLLVACCWMAGVHPPMLHKVRLFKWLPSIHVVACVPPWVCMDCLLLDLDVVGCGGWSDGWMVG